MGLVFCIIINSQNSISEHLVKVTGAKVTSLDFSRQKKYKTAYKVLLQVSLC